MATPLHQHDVWRKRESAYASGVLRANLETGWIQPEHLLLEVVGRVERVVPDVDVALKSEGELSVGEEFGGNCVPINNEGR